MTDYRDYPNGPEYPIRRDAKFDPDLRSSNTAWGWIAAAIFAVVVLAVAFGFEHQPGGTNNVASNDATPPAATRMAPNPATPNPATMAPPAMAPTTMAPVPANPAPPITPGAPAPANH